METNVSKISLLWVVIMVGFAMHMLADLLPLCWGANVAMPDATGWEEGKEEGRAEDRTEGEAKGRAEG